VRIVFEVATEVRMLDSENPVVRLCMRANDAELGGDLDGARALLKEAWPTRSRAGHSRP